MKNIKCIALDLDGTTLDDDSNLSRLNREAIKEAIDSGIEVMVASGRTITSIPNELLTMQGIRYAITSNGAAVYTCPDFTCIKQCLLSEDTVKKILKLTAGYNIGREAFIDGVPYAQREYVENPTAFGAPSNIISYVKSSRTIVENLNDFVLEHIGEIEGLDFIVADEELRNRLKKEIPELSKDVAVTSSVNRRIEAIPIEAGKENALSFLLQRIGISLRDTAAFGDADNDASMLKAVGFGFAMENASPAAKTAAGYMTDSNGENGVGKGIYRILSGRR